MASMTMTASFLGNSSSALANNRSPATIKRRLVVVANAGRTEKQNDNNNNNNNGRRNIMFTAAAAAICSVAGIAVADEPKAGSAEAKKVYAPICVTMPTARVCRKAAPNRE
ncbi:hypothetical protein TanjilG_17494 [Lupinus angustifolius]|uniref:Photosystem II 5 kDa protein, chloroplastic n=1 Tax=Lupinus angustifolius TaxID=3871 RepID=A0A4P1R2H2_LUPAN|nr:PREDICTED: photosystem II 5 kDa protein, chloroplastic [Lupinus angustifolius]OIV99684.1 hypothetical protein TanjilG_17494 [Lupinus angustifolius]